MIDNYITVTGQQPEGWLVVGFGVRQVFNTRSSAESYCRELNTNGNISDYKCFPLYRGTQ